MSSMFRCNFFYLAACSPEGLAFLAIGRFLCEECRAMIDRVRQYLVSDRASFSRGDFLSTSAAVSGGLAITSVGSGLARAAPLKEVRFSEAVHNLGYINLYVG